jgi:hypothetical protein
MWNATGIWMWIMYIIFSLAVAIVPLSIYIDIARAEKSKNEKKAAFYRNACLKTIAMVFIAIAWLIFSINIRLREEAHDFGISDKQCITLSAESGWSESDVRDYLTITAKNDGSIEAAIAHIKGEE